MKKFLLLILLSLTTQCYCQRLTASDSLKIVMSNLSLASDMMLKQHKQYNTGLTLSLVGVTTSGFLYYMGSKNVDMREPMYMTSGLFSVMSLVGTVMMIDSHKYTKKTAIYLKQAGAGIGVGLKF